MKRDPSTHWRTAYGELQLQLPRDAFDTWLRDAKFLAYEDGTYIIGVPTVYARDWLEHRLKKVITRSLSGIAKEDVEIDFVVWRPEDRRRSQDIHEAGPLLAPLAPPPEPEFEPLPPGETGLNPTMTFETLAVGACNRVAHAAALAVVEMPGMQFNPLYIQGGVGMGKSHLMQAIGNACVERGMHVLYVSAETFTNDLVAAIKQKRTIEFREKYRSVEVLLLDDAEFLGGKPSTMEEFDHTFNDLYTAGAQVVIGASRAPADIPKLDNRLRSRFEGGLVVELQPPDYLTRVDILESKAHQRGFTERLPLDTLETIAERIEGSIRDLEGALNQVIAASLVAPTDAAHIEQTLDRVKARPPDEITLEDIVAAVTDYYGLTADVIYGRGRAREVSTARQVVMYIAREEADIPLQQIGDALGGRHHSTVSYSCERVSDMLRVDSALRRQVTTIVRGLRPRSSHYAPIEE